jgi:hypothetical protein
MVRRVDSPSGRAEAPAIDHLRRATAHLRAARSSAETWRRRPAGLVADLYQMEITALEVLVRAQGGQP